MGLQYAITTVLGALFLLLAPYTHAVRSLNPPTLIVSNLVAFVSSDVKIPSHLGFNVLDPRDDYYGYAACIISTNNTISADWTSCDPLFSGHAEPMDVSFMIDRDFVKLRRPWTEGDTYMIGTTDEQPTRWLDEPLPGRECSNVTTSPAGTYFTRTTDWEFPVVTIIS
ncbi:hypothetical protein K504DRAFT_494369 [Pleomassaria siparia CBS 279.74]|uniref:Uncharacterized protein n=1 Tax=Pleomassaria siparia CBS 279.74 TaxID=1314801 RepID=A0A6G1JWJ8_9PLEO|nr:hypothetical protein K504DRAFT_494369 [Pleomassaria siparia CBS 279.74]